MPRHSADNAEPEQTLAVRELLTADAFTHAVTQLELRETHISWVVLTGPCAYKIKKPVKLDFIDASTLDRRRHYCEEEVRLNRRLAPDLYSGVVAITRDNGRAVVGGKGCVVEYAVKMQQFSPSSELPQLLARDEVGIAEIAALGEVLARFHLCAAGATATEMPDKTEQMYDSVLGNLAQLITHLGPFDLSPVLGRLADWTHETAHALEATFQMRERSGFVRECHGDLHAANIVRLQGRLVPFDCIEFDPRLRWIDVMSDIAFLVMDLVSHRRGDLAFALLSRYLEVTGDYDGTTVLPFYAVYRALVRAKVDAITVGQVPARAAEFRTRLQQRIQAALRWMTPRHPTMVLMHGASGSGKSWLSERLVHEVQAIRIRSDLERKRLAGLGAQESAAAEVRHGIYSPEFSHRTYGRLADCAESALRAGFSVIVDAAFLDSTDRQMFCALAARLGTPLVIVSCQADPTTLAARVIERSARHEGPSDATLSVLDTQLREIRPFEASEQSHVVPVDTSEPDAVQRVAAAIAARSNVTSSRYSGTLAGQPSSA
jgi:aminoglycoside phosphotransferase family enzyme/predicted kinase